MVKLLLSSILALWAVQNVASFRIPSPKVTQYCGTRSYRIHAETDTSLLEINETNVQKVLDLVRPQLASDGGGVSLLSVDDHEVQIKFEGSCKTCPYRISTVKGVIESSLVRFLKAKPGKQITVKLVEEV